MRTMLIALLALAPLLSHADAAAAPVTSATALQKVGQAKLRVLFWDVYESVLYCPGGDYQAGERPLRLEIRYLRNVRSDDLVAQTKKEWDAQGLAHPNQSEWLARLGELWPDVSENDVITLDIDDRNRAQFILNGEPLGSIEDPAFSEQFAAIWLSPNTTYPKLRRALIGEG